MRHRWDDLAGELLVRLAAQLHRRMTSNEARARWLAHRNRLLRAAHGRGVDVAKLARRLHLTEGHLRSNVLREGSPAGRRRSRVLDAAERGRWVT